MINEQFKTQIAPFYKKWTVQKIYLFEGMMDYEGVLGATTTFLLGFDYYKVDGEDEPRSKERHKYLLDNNFFTMEEYNAVCKFVSFFEQAADTGVPPMDMMREDLYKQFLQMREELFSIESLQELLKEIEFEQKHNPTFYKRSFFDLKKE